MRKELKILGVLALSLMSQMAFAQINGKVQESDGEPSIGAKVEIKGTNTFTRANDDGEFELSEAKVGDVLVITNLDEQTQEVKATDNLVFKFVKDAKKEKEIEGVTVIGTISMPTGHKIGANNTLKATDLESTPLASINEVLDGRVAGLSFSGAGGQPGSTTNITIRGINSFTGSSNPLYVIDGVAVGKGTSNSDLLEAYSSFSPLSSLDPNSIESIVVLKDAAGTSLYGSQGANGVIIITTKSGKFNQKTKFSFTSEFGYQDVAFNKHKWMNAQELLEYGALTLAGKEYASGNSSVYSEENMNKLRGDYRNELIRLGWNGTTNTDWEKAIQRNSSVVNQYSFNATGGSETTSFNVGGAYYNNKPLVNNSKFDRYSFNLGLNHKASEKLRFNFKGNVTHVLTNTYLGGGSFSNPWASSWSLLPIYPVKNDDGSYNVLNLGGNKYFNPVELSEADYLKGAMTTFLGSLGMEYKFMKNMKYSSTFATQYQHIKETSWWNRLTGNARPTTPGKNGGSLQENNIDVFDYSWTNFVQYENRFAEKNDITIDVGVDYQEHSKRYAYVGVKEFPAYVKPELSNGATPSSGSGGKASWSQISYIGRLSYSFDRKYTFTGSFRRDGNSTFGDDNQWGNFWNVGAMWSLSNEAFLRDNNFISDLKLRGNYGTSGNTPMTEWDKLFYHKSLLTPTTYAANNTPALYISSAGNKDLKWEQSKQLNIGLDFGILNNRIYGSFEFYNKKTEDLITIVPAPYTTGGPNSSYANVGTIRNRGVELELTGVPFKKDFFWSITFTGSKNKSKVLSLPEFADGIGLIAYAKGLQEGKSAGEYYTYGWAGVDFGTGLGLFYTDETKTATTTDITQAKRFFQGSTPVPTWQATLLNEFGYKNFKLSFLLSGSFDYKVMDTYTRLWMSDGIQVGKYNQDASLLYDSWTPNNLNASNPIQVKDGSQITRPDGTKVLSSSNQESSRFLRKGDHIRLKDVKISYTFDKNFLGEGLGVDAITIYLRGTNLITWAFDSKLQSDPDSYSTSPRSQGYPDFYGTGTYNFGSPVMRSYSFGINVNF